MAEAEQACAISGSVRRFEGHDVPATISAAEYRNAMCLMGAAVNVVTTCGSGGRTGFTATAVCSVSDDPPSLLFCVNRRSTSLPAFLDSKVLCVNTLRAHHTDIADMFAGRSRVSGDERFAVGEWEASSNGCPVLKDALIAFECRILHLKTVSTHIVAFARVTGVGHGPPGSALVYQDRSYKAV